MVKTLWPHAMLHPFGSCISNFAMRNSDVDFCLVMPAWPDGTECDKSEVVARLAEYLERTGMLKVTALPNARVPIVKLVEVRHLGLALSCFHVAPPPTRPLPSCSIPPS